MVRYYLDLMEGLGIPAAPPEIRLSVDAGGNRPRPRPSCRRRPRSRTAPGRPQSGRGLRSGQALAGGTVCRAGRNSPGTSRRGNRRDGNRRGPDRRPRSSAPASRPAGGRPHGKNDAPGAPGGHPRPPPSSSPTTPDRCTWPTPSGFPSWPSSARPIRPSPRRITSRGPSSKKRSSAGPASIAVVPMITAA